jgi:integrase
VSAAVGEPGSAGRALENRRDPVLKVGTFAMKSGGQPTMPPSAQKTSSRPARMDRFRSRSFVVAALREQRQRFHDTRHAYGSLVLEAGEDLAIVSRLLGHTDIGTTANVYAHLSRTLQGRAADRLDGILGRSDPQMGVQMGVRRTRETPRTG